MLSEYQITTSLRSLNSKNADMQAVKALLELAASSTRHQPLCGAAGATITAKLARKKRPFLTIKKLEP
jgi:hypothetical protein